MNGTSPRAAARGSEVAQIMSDTPYRVVILGGGFGGLYAAQKLKKAPVELTLIDRRNFHCFQNRLLFMVQWAWDYWMRNRSARLITGALDGQDPRVATRGLSHHSPLTTHQPT